jgi:hypothetical protein
MANNYVIKDANGNNVTFISFDTGGGVELAESCPHDGTNKMTQLYNVNSGGSEYILGASIRISQAGASVEAKGQQTMANSLPVVVASNQSNLPANVAQFGGTNVVTGTGVGGAGIPRVTVSSDSAITQGTAAALASAWPVKCTDGSNTQPAGDVAARAIYERLGAQLADQMTEASLNFNAAGDNMVVAAVGGQKVRVHRLFLVCNGAVNIQIFDGASPTTPLTGVMNFLANGALVLDFSGEPWFPTSTGNGFNINLSSGVQVSGRLYYIQQ